MFDYSDKNALGFSIMKTLREETSMENEYTKYVCIYNYSVSLQITQS